MSDEHIIPVQLSIDENIAPDVELPPLIRGRRPDRPDHPGQPGERQLPRGPIPRPTISTSDDSLVAATPGWKHVITAVEGSGWHLIRRSRGGSKVVTLCGVGGRLTQRQAPAYVPCKDCQRIAEGGE